MFLYPLSFFCPSVRVCVTDRDTSNNPSGPTATYDLLWLYYKPGSVVYEEVDNEMIPYVISSVARLTLGDGSSHDVYSISYWNIAPQGCWLQRRMRNIQIEPWSGERDIANLELIPARFMDGGEDAARQKQIALGQRFWELAKTPSYREYSGIVVEKDGTRGGKVRYISSCSTQGSLLIC